MVETSEVAKAFALEVAGYNEVLKHVIDTEVYKSVQCFRIANTSKEGDPSDTSERFRNCSSAGPPLTEDELIGSLVLDVKGGKLLHPTKEIQTMIASPGRSCHDVNKYYGNREDETCCQTVDGEPYGSVRIGGSVTFPFDETC